MYSVLVSVLAFSFCNLVILIRTLVRSILCHCQVSQAQSRFFFPALASGGTKKMPQPRPRKSLTHLKTPLVHLGKPVTGFLEIRVFIPILATLSWRLHPCRRLAIVGLHSSGDWLDCLSLSHTFTSWKFFTITTVCWKRKKPSVNKS